MKTTNYILIGTLCIFSYLSAAYGKPYDVEGGGAYKNPLRCNLESVSFSWKLPPKHAGIEQTAYQIVVADAKESLDKDPLWNSGKVVSSQSVKIPYGGKTLKSRQKCYFKVRYWDENGKPLAKDTPRRADGRPVLSGAKSGKYRILLSE